MAYIVPKENIEFIDYRAFDILDKSTVEMKAVPIVGRRYSLKGRECDGFSMPRKVYEIKGMVNDFHGVSINSYVVKQVGGEEGYKFTLSKNDCEYLGIDFQQGLQLFPIDMDWIEDKEDVEMDVSDLSTYPSDVGNELSVVMLKINGFKDYIDGMIMTPNGKLVSEKNFLDHLNVVTRIPIVYDSRNYISEKTRLFSYVVKPKELLFKYGNYICEDGSIYMLVWFRRGFDNGLAKGADKRCLKGVNPYDAMLVFWDDSSHMSEEEYKAKKALAESKTNKPQPNVKVPTTPKPKDYKNLRSMMNADANLLLRNTDTNLLLRDVNAMVIEAMHDMLDIGLITPKTAIELFKPRMS